MKYTPCGQCSNGYIYTNDIAKKCDCLKQFQKLARIEINLKEAGIESFNCDFSSYVGKDKNCNIDKLKSYCTQATTKFKNNSHLYLTGKNGTQKTTLAKIILKKFIEQGFSGKFILMSDLVDILTDVFSDNPTRTQELDFLRNVSLLIIDDAFDKNKVVLYRSGYQLPYIDRLLRYRLEVAKVNTIFTSNVSINDISKNGFSYDIQNLLERSIQCKNAELFFEDIYTDSIDIQSIWD